MFTLSHDTISNIMYGKNARVELIIEAMVEVIEGEVDFDGNHYVIFVAELSNEERDMLKKRLDKICEVWFNHYLMFHDMALLKQQEKRARMLAAKADDLR